METYILNLRFKLNCISIYFEFTKKYRQVFKHVISFMTNYVLFFYILRNYEYPIRDNSRRGKERGLSPL